MDSGGQGHSEALGLLARMSSCLAKGNLFADEGYKDTACWSACQSGLVCFILHREFTPVHLCGSASPPHHSHKNEYRCQEPISPQEAYENVRRPSKKGGVPMIKLRRLAACLCVGV